MIIPFYTSSGTAGKVDADGNLFGVGEFFPVWGISEGGWFNKTSYTWKGHPEETAIANDDRSKYYGSTKLRQIANELDDLLPDFQAMLKEIGDQALPGMPDAEAINAMHVEFGLNHKAELNQGFTANGIVPVEGGGGVSKNVIKAKKIIGVDGPITYKLVPFKNGHNFAYRHAGRGAGRFYVLVDIKPKFTKKKEKPIQQERIKIRQTWGKKKKDNVVQLRNPGGEDDEWW